MLQEEAIQFLGASSTDEAIAKINELARAIRPPREPITSWSAMLAYLKAQMSLHPREQFRVLFLDHRNKLISDETVQEGSIAHCPVYPREIARRCIELNASSVILVHNHPTGDPTPSTADVDMTDKIQRALDAIGVRVHDHVVVGLDGVTSFRALGYLS